MKIITAFNGLIFLLVFINLLLINGESVNNGKCNERSVNMHMFQCYKEYIDPTFNENDYFLEGNLLCQNSNQSSDYRRCSSQIFDRNEICSFEIYPYTYEYSKIFWKLIIRSCLLEKNSLYIGCSPSPLSKEIINQCHYSFDQYFPTKCKKFFDSLKCLEKNEGELILSRSQSTCSRNKAYYYYYGDLAARLQLAINICE